MMVAPKNIWPESYTISISLNFSRFVCEIDICDLKYMSLSNILQYTEY